MIDYKPQAIVTQHENTRIDMENSYNMKKNHEQEKKIHYVNNFSPDPNYRNTLSRLLTAYTFDPLFH